ncbi:MAG TPA: hypothetical protein VLA29_09865 [Acidimicrobiia bacterium]|nr:hypothetical protein [Acidimicrobiia bacterium]
MGAEVETPESGSEGPEQEPPRPPNQTDNSFVVDRIDWVDVLATLVMAIAAVLTAWSAFQSDQWGDQMAFSLAQASAARTEATREFTRAGQVTEVDLASFFAWLEATQLDISEGRIELDASYEPDPSTLSGFLYLRFRPEFRIASDAWVETRPFVNPDAPPTPFAMPEYSVAEEAEATRLQALADSKYDEAQAADANDDKYVLSTIVFAAVFLFAGLSTKMRSRLGQNLMLGMGIVILLGVGIYIFTIPILA